MTFTLTTALREIVRTDHTMQPWEGHYLTREGFKLEQGLWVRRTGFEPRVFELVQEVPRRVDSAR